MIYGLYNIDDVPRYVMEGCYPKGMFIPKDHHYTLTINVKRGRRNELQRLLLVYGTSKHNNVMQPRFEEVDGSEANICTNRKLR